jgi:hypothetical protein
MRLLPADPVCRASNADLRYELIEDKYRARVSTGKKQPYLLLGTLKQIGRGSD